jgi:hypothetical protein
MAAAQAGNLFADEIVPMATKMKVVNKETKEESFVDYVVDKDECNRPDTTLEGLASLQPVKGPGNFVTAGNASQLSDGAAAVVLMLLLVRLRPNLWLLLTPNPQRLLQNQWNPPLWLKLRLRPPQSPRKPLSLPRIMSPRKSSNKFRSLTTISMIAERSNLITL